MTARSVTLADVEAALASLAVTAPPTLADRTLIEVGLADEYATHRTPIGDVHVAWNGLGISTIGRSESDASFERWFASQVGRPLRRSPAVPERLAQAIDRRLAGDRRARLPLDLRGRTPFEQAVWLKALEIPRGEVRPYGWIAAEIGRPRAVRAVGTALAHNPVPLVVPCHRVVRSDGMLGNYSLGGPRVKREILAAEGLDPDELERLARAGVRYTGSDTTRIYCLPTCRNARRTTEQHLVHFRSAAASEAAGYRACKVCRPDSAARAA
jgi:O-6-methylguanine DNA methyltransferase